jgi:mono/diheme cytochrome c family protein
MQFQNLSDDDLTAIVSFLRSQPAVKNELPRAELNFLGQAVNAFLIKPAGPDGDVPVSVKPDTTADYGKYLVMAVANCRSCHTERSALTGEYTGEELAGGNTFEHPEKGYTLTTPNLTPDPKTGRIHDWTYEMFRDRFRTGRLIPDSEMPWDQFKRLSDDDLKAIYKYLMSLPPVENEIQVMTMNIAE